MNLLRIRILANNGHFTASAPRVDHVNPENDLELLLFTAGVPTLYRVHGRGYDKESAERYRIEAKAHPWQA